MRAPTRRFDAVITAACRTPIGSFGGALKDLSAADLGSIVIREAVNRVCGSGLTAVVHAVEAVHGGYTDAIVAGDTESMSNAPYLLAGARWGARMGHQSLVDSLLTEGLTCAIDGCHMGITAEQVAIRFGISRADQDAFALESQHRAVRAMDSGSFAMEIVPVSVPQQRGGPVTVSHDEYPRRDTTLERLGALTPAFQTGGTVTAGNASGINDGAAALVVTTTERAGRSGVTPLARVVSYATIGVEPGYMGIGPVPAISRALERAGLATEDVDLFELNEAFAAQSLAVIRELHLDPARVNVSGGAIALGHPIGASGARVLTTLLHLLRARKGRIGVVSLCIGGGMGIAMVVEAL